MKILFISQLIPIQKGHIRNSDALFEFLEEWSKKHEIHAVRPLFKYEKLKHNGKTVFEKAGIPILIIKPFRIPILKTTYYSYKKLLRKLEWKPDVLICHLYNAYLPFQNIAKHLGIPFIIGIHMSDVNFSRKWFYRKLQFKALKKCDGIACRSIALMEKFIQQFPQFQSKTFIAASGIPYSYTNYAKQLLSSKSARGQAKTIKFITVGALIKLKHIDNVVKALSRIKDEHSWHYTIVGDGPMKEKLKALTIKKGIADRVTFSGRLTRSETFIELKKSDVFILTSYPETLGLVYLEAMSAGNIIICSKGWGVDGFIKSNENGFAVDPYNSDELANIIKYVLKLSESRRAEIRRNSLELISKMDIKTMADTYLENIEQIAERFYN